MSCILHILYIYVYFINFFSDFIYHRSWFSAELEPIYYDYEYLTHSYLHVTHKIFNNSNVGEGDLVQHSKVALTRIKKGRPTSKIRLYSTDKDFLLIFLRKIRLSIDQLVRIYWPPSIFLLLIQPHLEPDRKFWLGIFFLFELINIKR